MVTQQRDKATEGCQVACAGTSSGYVEKAQIRSSFENCPPPRLAFIFDSSSSCLSWSDRVGAITPASKSAYPFFFFFFFFGDTAAGAAATAAVAVAVASAVAAATGAFSGSDSSIASPAPSAGVVAATGGVGKDAVESATGAGAGGTAAAAGATTAGFTFCSSVVVASTEDAAAATGTLVGEEGDCGCTEDKRGQALRQKKILIFTAIEYFAQSAIDHSHTGCTKGCSAG